MQYEPMTWNIKAVNNDFKSHIFHPTYTKSYAFVLFFNKCSLMFENKWLIITILLMFHKNTKRWS